MIRNPNSQTWLRVKSTELKIENWELGAESLRSRAIKKWYKIQIRRSCVESLELRIKGQRGERECGLVIYNNYSNLCYITQIQNIWL